MDTKKIELGGRKYILHKIPAFKAQKIAFQCFNALKTKDLAGVPDDVLLDICSFIGAENASGYEVMLTDAEFINVNVKDAGVLMMLELSLLEYNFGFFFDGSLSKEIEKILGGLLTQTTEAAATGSSKA